MMYTHRKVRSPENAADARAYAQSQRRRFFGNTTLAEDGGFRLCIVSEVPR